MIHNLKFLPDLTIRFVPYRLDAGTDEHKKLVAKLKKQHSPLFDHNIDVNRAETIPSEPWTEQLEPALLFDNQFNTEKNRRFDWLEQWRFMPNNHNKRMPQRSGYHLDAKSQKLLNDLRRIFYICGYCGAPYWGHQAPIFCHKCAGSEYLKDSELHTTAVNPLIGPKRTAAVDEAVRAQVEKARAEQAIIRVQQQDARRLRQIAKIEEELESEIENAKIEAAAKIAILKARLDLDNYIYYTHTNCHTVGWRKKLTEEERHAWLDAKLPFVIDFVNPRS